MSDTPSITRDDVAHLARLARHRRATDERARPLRRAACSVILGAVARVSEVAARRRPADVATRCRSTNVFREDVVRPSLSNAEALSGAPRSSPSGSACRGSSTRSERPRDRPDQAHRGRDRRSRRLGRGVAPSRSLRRTSTASRPSTSACTPSCTSTPRARSPRPPRSTRRRAAGEELGPLAGVPLALKDVMNHEGHARPPAGRGSSRAGVPPYDATVVGAAARGPAS